MFVSLNRKLRKENLFVLLSVPQADVDPELLVVW
jgi:hypothetical protein